MAYQGIGTGTTPNDSTGDSLLVGAIKINSNFEELYTALGDGNIITFDQNRNVNTGDGLSGGGNLTADRTLTVDSTVLRTSGGQTIDGSLTATSFAGNGTIPVGGIIMWSGSTESIPTGWALCDGQNSTPDLRDRFIVGAGNGYAVGTTGGSKDAIVPYHNHTAATDSIDSGHTHGGTTGGSGYSFGYNFGSTGRSSGGANSVQTYSQSDHTHNFTTNNGFANITSTTTVDHAGTEGNATNANLPPYYALAFIMRTA